MATRQSIVLLKLMRLKSGIWVAAYLRRCAVEGVFAAVRRRGAEEAGGIFIKINRLARIHAESGTTCECTITDFSEGGARLFVPDIQLPDQFVLAITGDTLTREECRVAWRLGGEMGVQFVTRSVQQARAPAVDQLRAIAQQRFKKQA